MNDDPLFVELKTELAEERVVPVIGSGVSTAVAGIPGWLGVIRNAVEHCVMTGCFATEEADAVRALIDGKSLIEAAELVKSAMGAPYGEYPLWLKKQFGTFKGDWESNVLIDAIADLLPSIFVTTNYDRLLSTLLPDRPNSVVWNAPAKLQTGIREGGVVLHLHGIYDEPETVVFGAADYANVVKSPAYQQVLRSLWIERTLLFIGCSFDGLKDPDFSSLMRWASTTFQGSPYKHYALLKTGSYTRDEAQQYLKEFRVQVLPFGSEYEDLPKRLFSINPKREQAIAHRILLARRLLANNDPDERQRFAEVIQAVVKPQARRNELRELSEQLFQERSQSAARVRKDLETLQKLALLIVDPEALRRQVSDWSRKQTKYAGAFRETALQAASALALFPDDLLAALHRRRVNVHANVLSGISAGYLKLLEEHSRSPMYEDEYGVENVKRIMSSLVAILDADPAEVFPTPQTGITPSRLSGDYLQVARANRIELRPTRDPEKVAALLPVEGPAIIDAESVTFRNRQVIAAYNSERVLLWDPMDRAPMAEFAVNLAYGIFGVAHSVDRNLLHTFVSTVEGTMYRLNDLKSIDVWAGPNKIVDAAFSPEGRLYGLADSFRVFEVDLIRHSSRQIIGVDQALSYLIKTSTIPPPSKDDLHSGLGYSNWFQHSRLSGALFDGRFGLKVSFVYGGPGSWNAADAVIDPEREEIIALYYNRLGLSSPHSIIVDGKDGAPSYLFRNSWVLSALNL